jgi:hypothetical protein
MKNKIRSDMSHPGGKTTKYGSRKIDFFIDICAVDAYIHADILNRP